MFKSFEDYKQFVEEQLGKLPEQRAKGDIDGANLTHTCICHSLLQHLMTKDHDFTQEQTAILAGIVMSYADYGEPYEQNRRCLVA